MAYNFVFYKSYANKWLALGVDDRKGEVWYSHDGSMFYPLVATTIEGGTQLEDMRGYGPELWRGKLREETLEDGSLVLRLSITPSGNPIFRLVEKLDAGMVFNPSPKFREIQGLYEILETGQLLLLTGFNGPHFSIGTLNLYIGRIGKGFVRNRTLKIGSNYAILTTDLGVLDTSRAEWEGYPMKALRTKDYIYSESELSLTLEKK